MADETIVDSNIEDVNKANEKEQIKVYGIYEPNITTGLTLPVVCIIKGDIVINMQHVPSHIRVGCSEETEEMTNWIKEGKLIKVEEEV